MAEPGYVWHLEELRKKIISIFIVMLAVSVAAFCFITPIMHFLQAPIGGLDIKLNYFTPYEKFGAYMKVAFFAGLFLTVPFALFQIGSFAYPALKKNERSWFYVFMSAVPVLLFGGFAFGYYVLVPAAFRFFANFASGDNVQAVWGISSYFDLVTSMIFWSGIIFQVPLALLFLIRAGLLRVQTLEKFRKVIIVLIFIIAGVLTPPDVMSQILMAVPLYLLFELSVAVGKVIK